jgi:alpha-tubulin suppressor-like RCC1 family protein
MTWRSCLLLPLLAFGLGCGGGGETPPLPEPQIPAHLAVVAGDEQRATAGLSVQVAPAVRVTDAGGAPVAGVAVSFTVTSGGGSIDGAEATTDASGVATAGAWSLGATVGTNSLRADVTGLAPASVSALGVAFDQLAAGALHTCGRTVEGVVYCWGFNHWGQLGDGTPTDHALPAPVAGNHTFVSLTSGDWHTCAQAADGATWCWGMNERGQLGDGTFTNRTEPTLVTGGHDFSQLSLGWMHSCGIDADGATLCWGSNEYVQVGDGSGADQPEPVNVSGNLRFTQVEAGSYHTCALTAAGVMYCWGSNPNGELAAGTIDPITRTTPGVSASGSTFRVLADGATCALTDDAATYCWGAVAIQNGTQNYTVPTLRGGAPAFIAISGNSFSACGLDKSHGAWCWGNNSEGQLGTAEGTDAWLPNPLAVLLTLETVRAGGTHTCATATTGLSYCWGSNVNGEVGDGSTAERRSPVPVAFP